MADVAPVPFINFGLSQQQQAQAGASANLQNQEANVQSQQAQQQAMQTELLKRSMPLYRQTIDDMTADMQGTPTGNALVPTNEKQAIADSSGVPAYADQGAIAENARAMNYVQPVTQGEQQAMYKGALMASLPGPAANPAYLKMAQMQNQFRVKNQTAQNQYRSGQLYDVMTAVQDPDNQDPLGMLRAVPGQDAVVAQIVKDHPNDPDAQQAAARQYAQTTAFHMHQYTGRGQTMQNGTLVDTTVGAPVTGQDQVLTGLTPKERAQAMQWAQEQIKVVLNTNETTMMPRYKAPTTQGGLGMTPEAFVARQDALARQHLQDPNSPVPGATTWNHPDAIGNNAGAAAAAKGNTLPQHAPAAQPGLPPGTRPAVGQQLMSLRSQNTQTQAATDAVPSPTTALRGPVPETGTPAYTNRLTAALKDPTYKARWNVQPQPGLPVPGAKEGIAQYQTQRNELMKESGEMSQSADQALQNFNAAKMIFDSNAPLTGPLGALEQKVAATLGLDWNAPATRQEVAKYLVNGAVSGLKQTYGSRPGVFDVKINVEKAFPNIDEMSPPAVRNLIDSQIKQAQYLKDASIRGQVYANKGLEPNSFGTWNSTYFPRSELLDSTYGGKPPAGAETRSYKGDNYYLKAGADRKKPESWVKYKAAT